MHLVIGPVFHAMHTLYVIDSAVCYHATAHSYHKVVQLWGPTLITISISHGYQVEQVMWILFSTNAIAFGRTENYTTM